MAVTMTPKLSAIVTLSVFLALALAGIGVAIFFAVRAESSAATKHREILSTDRKSIQPLSSPGPLRVLGNSGVEIRRAVNVPRKLINIKPSRFPRFLIQSYKTQNMPKGLTRNVINNLNMNPGWGHMYFDDLDSQLFMHEHFAGKVADAYDLLLPGAFKCDIFRLAALYKYGGVYADIYMELPIPLDELLSEPCVPKETTLVVVRDGCKHALYQAFLAATPQNPYILAMLEGCVQRSHDRAYRFGCLGITGPHAVGQILNKYIDRSMKTSWRLHELAPKSTVYVLRHNIKDRSIDDHTGRMVVRTRYVGFERARTAHGRHYSQYFKDNLAFFPVVHVPRNLTRFSPVRVLYQTWESRYLMPNMAFCVSKWEKAAEKCSHEYRFIDAPARRKQIQKAHAEDPLQRVIRAHDALIPGVLRADLWRLTQLKATGGVTVDLATVPTLSALKRILKGPALHDLVLVLNEDTGHLSTRFISTSAPNHPLINSTLEQLCASVTSRSMSSKPSDLRAGLALSSAFRLLYGEPFPGICGAANALILVEREGKVIDPRTNEEVLSLEKVRKEVYNNSDLEMAVKEGVVYRSDELTRQIVVRA